MARALSWIAAVCVRAGVCCKRVLGDVFDGMALSVWSTTTVVAAVVIIGVACCVGCGTMLVGCGTMLVGCSTMLVGGGCACWTMFVCTDAVGAMG